MVLSKGCIYAIQAAIYIASADSSTGVSPVVEYSEHESPEAVAADVAWKRHRPSVSVGEISTRLNISFHFLTKILQQLTSANLTHSHRGPNGGIALARPASDISLYDIIVAVDGPGLFLDCLLRPGYCGENGTCTAHVVWEPIRKKFMESAKRTTVAALAETTLHLNETPAETLDRHFETTQSRISRLRESTESLEHSAFENDERAGVPPFHDKEQSVARSEEVV